MKTKLLLLMLFATIAAQAQYFQRIFNLDYVTPALRDELLNSGLRSRVNYTGGLPANYAHTGIGVSRYNSTLASPNNRADWLRFIRVNKTGATVLNNRGIEYRDFDTDLQYHAAGNSIAEVSNGAGTGGYIAVGSVGDNTITGATVPGGSDALYTVLSTTGAVTGAFRIDFGSTYDVARCIRHSSFVPNTWLVCGEATYYPPGATPYTNCFVARLDNLGNIIWCFTYNFDPTITANIPTANCIAKQLAEDPATGEIYVVGTVKDFTGGNGSDGLVFKLNSGGGFINSLLYHLAPEDAFEAVRWTLDGNIIVGGFTNWSNAGVSRYNMLLVKVSPAGVIVFQNILQVRSPGGVKFQSKCFDLVERPVSMFPPQSEFYLFGPKYVGTTAHQVMYRTNGMGVGLNSYTYNQQKFDYGYGIDLADNTFAKPGIALFSSVIDTVSGFSHSHMMKTYFNGAACTNYCPADPPNTTAKNVNPPFPQPFMYQNCTIADIKWKNYNFQSVLNCNQANIGCGGNDKQDEGVNGIISPEHVFLYPNPAEQVLNIEWYNPAEGKNEWQIIDVQGRVLISQTENLPEGTVTRQLDLSKLVSGYYILKITNEQGEHRKVVIRQ